MRFVKGRKARTVDLVYEDFGRGIQLMGAEHMHPEYGLVRSALYIENFEISPWGDLIQRPDGSRITLVDPSTNQPLEEECLRTIKYEHVNGCLEYLLATPTRLFSIEPLATQNLTEITIEGGHAFPHRAELVDAAVWLDKLFITSGSDYGIQYDGREATYFTKDWPDGYRYPGSCRRHQGRLFLSGWTGLNDSRAASVLRWTTTEGVELEDMILEIRTMDDESPVGMASLQSGLSSMEVAGSRAMSALVVWKQHNTMVVTGSDFSPLLTDVEKHTHTPGVGMVGPYAWCWGRKGIYFASELGIHLLSSMEPAKSLTDHSIAPFWGRVLPHAQVNVPRAMRANLSRTCLWFNPDRDQVFVHLPVHSVA